MAIMSGFTWALTLFLLLHVGLSATGARALVVGRIGEGPYRGLFSLASAALLIWLGFAFVEIHRAPDHPLMTPLYAPPEWGRYAAQGLTLLAFLIGATGLLTLNPTTAGLEGALKREEPAKGMVRITRHPFLWAVAIWAAGHLLANGERFAVMMFGVFGLMALLGTRSIDRKSAARDPEHWAKFAAVTSNVPFAAIVQGRNRIVWSELGWRPLVALAAYAAIAYGHAWLVGVPAIP
ncbi:MAG: NnrU family protein [Hyphomonadaceae bacterium]